MAEDFDFIDDFLLPWGGKVFTLVGSASVAPIPGAAPLGAIGQAMQSRDMYYDEQKRRQGLLEESKAQAAAQGAPAPTQAAPGSVEAAQQEASAAPPPPGVTSSSGKSEWIGMADGYVYDPENHSFEGDRAPVYRQGQQDNYWQTLGNKEIIAKKKLLYQAGYYKDKPFFSNIITEEDVKALETAMGETNRSDYATWEDAASKRIRAITGDSADSLTRAERQAQNADYHVAVNDLESFGFENGIKLKNEDIKRWATRAAKGERSLEQTKAHLTDKFISRMYPALREDLKAGYTVRDAAGPYLQTLTDLLGEANPNLNDPLVRKALQGRTEKGEPTLMPLWQFEEEVKKDKRYQYSDAAWQEEGDKYAQIMGMFGLL